MDPNTVDHELSDAERRAVEFYDGELSAGECANFEAELALEPSMRVGLDNWAFMGEAVRTSLEINSAAVPQARFEQAWDQFDATLAREGRLQDAVEQRPSLWARISSVLMPLRVPMAAAAAAAVIAVVAFSNGDSPADGAPAVAVAPAPVVTPEVVPEATPVPEVTPDRLAVAPADEPSADDFADPVSNEAEIERIEFGGRSGTISKVEGARGTTTVIWVQEDEEPVESERSL